VKDAGLAGALAARPRRGPELAGNVTAKPGSLDTRRCYIRFRQCRGSCPAGAGAVPAELNIMALVSGSRKHSFMTVPNEAKPFCARGSSGSYPGA